MATFNNIHIIINCIPNDVDESKNILYILVTAGSVTDARQVTGRHEVTILTEPYHN